MKYLYGAGDCKCGLTSKKRCMDCGRGECPACPCDEQLHIKQEFSSEYGWKKTKIAKLDETNGIGSSIYIVEVLTMHGWKEFSLKLSKDAIFTWLIGKSFYPGFIGQKNIVAFSIPVLRLYTNINVFSGLSHDCFLKGLLQSIGKYLRLTVVDELDDTQDRIFKAFSKACHSYQRGQFNIDSLKAVGKEKVFKFCPACPRNGGKMFLCLDGCFTSGRLTKAGKI
jgi:hypothetical protein